MVADARSFAHVPHPYAEGPAESTRRDHAIAEQDVRGEELLLDLARVLNARYPLEASPNRPTLPAGDKVAVSVMRSLHRKGMRRSRKVLERLAQSGGIAFAPCKNSQVAYNVDPRTTRYVRDGIGIAASPYTLMEQDVIMDASGFSTFFNSCWRDSGARPTEHPAWHDMVQGPHRHRPYQQGDTRRRRDNARRPGVPETRRTCDR